MRSGSIAAATILCLNAVTAWSYESETSPSLLIPESNRLHSTASDDHEEPETDDWTEPPLASKSSYFANSPSADNSSRFWGSAQLMMWSLSRGHTPPLVTQGTVASLGALGPGTTTLYGGDQSNTPQIGARFTAGTWLDPSQTKGIEGSYFFMNNASNVFSASGSGAPGTSVLARPFTNAISGLPDSQIICFPGISSGSCVITSTSQFQGAQLIGLCNLFCCPTSCCDSTCGKQTGYRLDMLGGVQYLSLNEGLGISENLTVLPTAPAGLIPGSTISATDSFQTRNSFYGGQIGARGEWYRGAWFANVSSQVALGDVHQEAMINGSTVFTSPGTAPSQQAGGVLALPTNIGNYNRDKFAVVPQIGLNVGRQLTNNVRIFAGYNLIYWSSVLRPGDQIDPVINPTQLPTPTGPGALVGPARPAFAFHDSDLWVHGISLGLEFRR